MRVVFAVCLAGLIGGCASSSNEIRPQYVSHIQYQNLGCQQIAAEMERVSRRVSEVSGVQDGNKTQDAWVTGAAIVVFWPAAFFIKGDGATAAELGRLKGEFEALERASNEKSCGLQVRKSEMPPQDRPASKRRESDRRNESY
jgi:hypothetical protein